MSGHRRTLGVLFGAIMGLAVVASGPSAVAAAQGGAGRASGLVRLTVAGSAPSGASVYGGRSVRPKAKAQPEMGNVVVFLADAPALVDLKAMRSAIAQRDEQFVPHLVAVTMGSTVDFPNQDPFFHNVFSLSRPATFDLGRYPSGATRAQRFLRAGLVKVYCHFHSQMSAVVRVFGHPWFTVPDASGAFSLDDIPAGEQTLVAWHERIGERRVRVTIRPGATIDVNFTLPVLEPTP